MIHIFDDFKHFYKEVMWLVLWLSLPAGHYH